MQYISAITPCLESVHLALQHYAVKTLENLYTKNDLWTDSLAQPSTAGKLLMPTQSQSSTSTLFMLLLNAC